MISAGVEGRLPCMTMTYPTEPWRGPPKQPPEFLRPLPKLPARYNGINTSTPNGTRLAPPARPTPLPAHVSIPSLKDEVNEEITPYSQYRLFPHPSHSFTHFNHYPIYQSPQYAQHMMRQNFAPSTPLTSLETYSPTTPTPPTPPASATTTFLPPPPRTTFSPPSSTAVKPGQSILRDKRTPPIPQTQTTPPLAQSQVSFKIPSGKEGSMKHRILTRPEDINRNIPLDLQQKSPGEAQMTRKIVSSEPQQTIVNRKPTNDVMISKKPESTAPRKRLVASTMSPPRSPKKTLNNNVVVRSFNKGSLVQLFNGELRKIEDMRTEDFVLSAEKCPELRLADSTVVKIEENQLTGNAAITLTYNQRRTQVEVHSSLEHPYFVYGQGWASCNPEKTQQHFGLKVHRLQVGDILISLTPREPLSPSSTPSKSSTIMTTATTTAMTVRASNVQQRIPTSLEQHPLGSLNLNYLPNIKTSIDNNNIMSSHSRTILTSDGNIVIKSEPPPIRTLNINESGPSGVQVQVQPINLHSSANIQIQSAPLSPNSLAARKRRWSAPDQMSDEEEHIRRHRVE